MHSDGRAGRRGVHDANAPEGRGAAAKVKRKSESKVCARPLPKCPVRVIGGNLYPSSSLFNRSSVRTEAERGGKRDVRHEGGCKMCELRFLSLTQSLRRLLNALMS